MSNQTFTPSRRNFLKGAAYTSALSLGGLTSLAYAAEHLDGTKTTTLNKSAELADSGISVIQQKTLHGETVTLINHSDKMVMVDALKPITLEQVNSSLVVKVNQIESEAVNGMIAISPSERISFEIKAVGEDLTNAKILPLANLNGNHLQITSEYSIFNRIVPVQVV